VKPSHLKPLQSLAESAVKRQNISDSQVQQGAKELAKEFFKLLTTELLKTVKFDSSSELEEDFLKSQLGEIFAGHFAETAHSIVRDLEKAMQQVKKG
jgi:hypothetical protein